MTDRTTSGSTSRYQLLISPAVFGNVAAVLICVLFAAVLLPSLGRLDFFDGVELFNLTTVQEMRRNEADHVKVNWMLPTLEGEARVVKPPLTAWITAALITPEHVTAMSHPDAETREQAVERFVAVSRLPTVACSCLLLLGVYVLGRAVGGGDSRVGAAAALMCAGTVIFFQQGRRATTDLQLALWVTWTNALLAVAILRRRPLLGYGGGGLALGLASMAKGPHIALLMTVAPAVVFLIKRRVLRHRASSPAITSETHGQRSTAAHATQPNATQPNATQSVGIPILIGVILAAAVGLWWYGYVARTVPDIWETWRREILRKDAQVGHNKMADDPWYAYAAFFGLLLPWTGWIVLGALWTIRECRCREPSGTLQEPQGVRLGSPDLLHEHERTAPNLSPLLPLLWVIVPILVMSCFAEKKERYLLPFTSSAAALGAWAMIRWWDLHCAVIRARKQSRSPVATAAPPTPAPPQTEDRFDLPLGLAAGLFTFAAAAWLSLSVAVGGAMGSKGFTTALDQPWFTKQSAMMIGAATLAILLMGIVRSRRNLIAPLLAVTVVSWLGSEMKLRGRAASPGDSDDRPQRELAAEIWQRWPAARIYSADPVTLYGQLNLPAIVLSFHLNRLIETRPANLPATPQDTPVVLITDAEAPPPTPPGWQRVKVVPLRNRKLMRYVDVLTR